MALKAFRVLTYVGIIALASTTSSATSPTLPPPISRTVHPLVFDRVPTSFAIETFFQMVSRAPFVLCSEVLEDKRLVTLRLSPEYVTLRSFTTFLRARGYRAFNQDGLFVVCGTGPIGLATSSTDFGEDVKDAPSSQYTERLAQSISPQHVGGAITPADTSTPNASAVSIVTGVYQTRFRPAHELAQIVRPLLPGVRVVTTGAEVRSGDISTPAGGEIAYAGSGDDVSGLLALLSSLDTRPSSVEIQAVLVEVTRSRNDSWGVEVVGALLRDQLGVSVSTQRGSQQLEFRFGDVSALLSALAGDARVDVLSAPFVSAENGRRTQLTVGEEVPVLGAVVSTSDGGSQQSIDYRSSGVILEVVPRVYRDALFLDLQQEVSSFARTQTGVNNSPTLTKRNLMTSLEVPEGAWVALGGLVSGRREVSNDRLFPGGPKVGRRDTKGEAELVLLVRVIRRSGRVA